MASTYRSLYDDFQDQVKNYVAKADITEHSFMRRITRGMQIFQRETELLWRRDTLTLGSNPSFPQSFIVPGDFMRIIEVRDVNSLPVQSTGYMQQQRITDQLQNNGTMIENPDDIQERIKHNFPAGEMMRTYSIVNRELILLPLRPTTDLTVVIVYVPDISAFDLISPEWSDWGSTVTNFMALFNTASVPHVFKSYEQALLDYAISDYIKSKNHINYLAYYKSFREEINMAKLNTPVNNKGNNLDYNFGVFG